MWRAVCADRLAPAVPTSPPLPGLFRTAPRPHGTQSAPGPPGSRSCLYPDWRTPVRDAAAPEPDCRSVSRPYPAALECATGRVGAATRREGEGSPLRTCPENAAVRRGWPAHLRFSGLTTRFAAARESQAAAFVPEGVVSPAVRAPRC